MAIKVRLQLYLKALLSIFGTDEEKGRVILFFLISIDRPFRTLSIAIPEDERNKIEVIIGIRSLVDRYAGILTDHDAVKLYKEFVERQDYFLEALGLLCGKEEVLDSAIQERVAIGVATREGFVKNHLRVAFGKSGFAVLLKWIRVLQVMHPKAVNRVLEQLEKAGNSQVKNTASGAKFAKKAQSSKGGQRRGMKFKSSKSKLREAWQVWQPEDGKKTIAGFVSEHSDNQFDLKLDPSTMGKWIRKEGW